jgi:hypothetical protein
MARVDLGALRSAFVIADSDGYYVSGKHAPPAFLLR